MTVQYQHIAVIGAGPSGLSAVKALSEEKKFASIRVFERRERVGGTWLFDPQPSPFPSQTQLKDRDDATTPANLGLPVPAVPSSLPHFAAPLPENTTQRTGLYDYLDSNVGASAMEFTYASLPKVNSALSVRRFGKANATRPWQIVAGYLEDLWARYLHLVTFSTTLERLSKNEKSGKWELVFRKSGVVYKGARKDFWWTESFDAVVVATGHYSIPNIPNIPGIADWYEKWPERLEHSKQFRSRDAYVDKTVVVVGGSVSASDIVLDTYTVVKAPLIVAQRGQFANPALESVWKLPGVVQKPTVTRLSTDNGGRVEFSDGSWINNVDKLVFATGYRLSYPFIQPNNPVTPQNRLAGFYQHIFKIGDPSLAFVGQVRAALSFRNFEYQAVAVARVLAGRGTLPSIAEQEAWEAKRLVERGPTHQFHTIAPDFQEYFNGLRDIAGPPAEDSEAYELPEWRDEWATLGFRVLELKDEYARRLLAGNGTKALAKL